MGFNLIVLPGVTAAEICSIRPPLRENCQKGGDCGGTDLLENGDFPLRKAKSADDGGVRATRFQGAESHEGGNRFILPFWPTRRHSRASSPTPGLDPLSRYTSAPVPVALLLPPRSRVVADCSPK
jgi:hypothetical protein